jgi:hypothetical protein
MSVERLKVIITEVRKELAIAEKKSRFWKNQYTKHKATPYLSDSIKVMRDSAASEVKKLAKEIGLLARIKKRYDEVEELRKNKK